MLNLEELKPHSLYMREWRTRNPERYREKAATNARKRRRANPEKYRAISRKVYIKLKLDVLIAYGGHCNCCGENQYEFLTLDHVNNDGAEHRRRLNTRGYAVYAEARKLGFPPTFQVLCMNCNFAKGIHGACPHGNS